MEEITVINKLILNNWGGFKSGHIVIPFSKNVSLITGDNGAGKTTVFDAMQVVMFGSSSINLNAAKKSNKRGDGERSILGYLKGPVKDHPFVRENKDFYANVTMEFYDEKTELHHCAGVVYKVEKNTTDKTPKHFFFIVTGPANEDEFKTLTFENLDSFIEERSNEYKDYKGVVNRKYDSNVNYRNDLHEKIYGGISQKVFRKLLESSISFHLPDGKIEDFMKEYIFLKSEVDFCKGMVEQAKDLDTVKRKVQEKQDMLEELNSICEDIDTYKKYHMDYETFKETTCCIKANIYEKSIKKIEESIKNNEDDIEKLRVKRVKAEEEKEKKIEKKAEVKNSLDNTNYGIKLQELKYKEKELENEKKNTEIWDKISSAFDKWLSYNAEDHELEIREILNCAKLGTLTKEKFNKLYEYINHSRDEVRKEYNTLYEKLLECKKKKIAIKEELENLKSNKANYRNIHIYDVKDELERKLKDKMGMDIPVYILSRTFEITDQRWKNAIEGRFGQKSSLIVEPQFSDIASELFENMRNTNYGVRLIDSKTMVEDVAIVKNNSLYECVVTDMDFIDKTLRYYLGGIIKCETKEELKKSQNGVTALCYAYSSRYFYHLNPLDYTNYASIGKDVSEDLILKKEDELENIKDVYISIQSNISSNEDKQNALNINNYNYDEFAEYGLSYENYKNMKEEITSLKEEIDTLKNGEYKKLEELLKTLDIELGNIKNHIYELDNDITGKTSKLNKEEQILETRRAELFDLYKLCNNGVFPKEISENANAWIKKENIRGFTDITSKRYEESTTLRMRYEGVQNSMISKKSVFNSHYQSYGLDESISSNEGFVELRNKIDEEIKDVYLEKLIALQNDTYSYLEKNLIGNINKNIKLAMKTKRQINEILSKYKFGNQTYQIHIEPARGEYGSYYEMLTAECLNLNVSSSKNEDQFTLADMQMDREFGDIKEKFVQNFVPPLEEDYNGDEKAYHFAKEEFEKKLEKMSDYRTYLKFIMKSESNSSSSSVEKTASIDSGGEEACPEYIVQLMGFMKLYRQLPDRPSTVKLVVLDEAFHNLDEKRIGTLLEYAKELKLQIIIGCPSSMGKSLKDMADNIIDFILPLDGRTVLQKFVK